MDGQCRQGFELKGFWYDAPGNAVSVATLGLGLCIYGMLTYLGRM